MAGMRDYILYLKNKQEQDPEWKAANVWHNRNQPKVAMKPIEPKVQEQDCTEVAEEPTENE